MDAFEGAIAATRPLLAHLWMCRTFLKHADEIQSSAEMLEVPRTLYDCVRAVEPAFERGDAAEYLRRLKGKVSKLRRAAQYFAEHYKTVSPHTNFEQCALSLSGAVAALEKLFADLGPLPAVPARERDALDSLEIPEV
jgi:hypothetical protein